MDWMILPMLWVFVSVLVKKSILFFSNCSFMAFWADVGLVVGVIVCCMPRCRRPIMYVPTPDKGPLMCDLVLQVIGVLGS